MSTVQLSISQQAIERLCQQYGVQHLSLFGSMLWSDFRPDSGIDILVTFKPEIALGFMTLSRLQQDLTMLLGRSVDLVSQNGLKPVIRDEVLDQAQTIYAI